MLVTYQKFSKISCLINIYMPLIFHGIWKNPLRLPPTYLSYGPLVHLNTLNFFSICSDKKNSVFVIVFVSIIYTNFIEQVISISESYIYYIYV